MHILVVAGAMEIVGYSARLYISTHTTDRQTTTPYLIYALFVLLPPILLILVNYYVAGRLLGIIQKPVRAIIKLQPSQIAKLFFASDVITLIVQAAGAGMLAIDDSSFRDPGMATGLVGLAIQLAFFLAFMWILLYIRMKKSFWEPLVAKLPTAGKIYFGLWWTTVMLLIRTVYRVVEFSQMSESYLHAYEEWIFFVFDSVAVFFAFVGFAVFHYAYLLRAEIKEDQNAVELSSV